MYSNNLLTYIQADGRMYSYTYIQTYVYMHACIKTCTHLNVLTVSRQEEEAGEMLAIITVRPFPIKDSLSTCIYVCAHIYKYTYIHMHIWMHVCAEACAVNARLYVGQYVCISGGMIMYMRTSV
jgi:hypothetical protein